jgi:pyridoxal phosphate enzyme (YggS family)
MSFKANLEKIRDKIASASVKSGRKPNDITLIAVTKNQPIEHLWEAYEAGLREFGENRVQDALPRIAALPKDIKWHLIGKLQSNKARVAAENFQVIHSLEFVRQLVEIEKANQPIDGLIQVNLAQETQKSGIFENDLDEFYKSVLQYDEVRFRGLMTIGPLGQDPESSRPLFRALSRLGETLGSPWLSMGMSNDFEVAIEEGSTHVRVGTALFGLRSKE